MSDQLGSPLYMPPEIVSNETYDNKVDIWSAGVMTYVLLVGKPPFEGNTKKEVFFAIKCKPPAMGEEEWSPLS